MRPLLILLAVAGCLGQPSCQDPHRNDTMRGRQADDGCEQVAHDTRAHVIDSLKAIYERLNAPNVAPVPGATGAQAPAPLPGNPSGEIYTDKQGHEYPVYTGAKGGRYYVRTSAKTGKPYRVYLKN